MKNIKKLEGVNALRVNFVIILVNNSIKMLKNPIYYFDIIYKKFYDFFRNKKKIKGIYKKFIKISIDNFKNNILLQDPITH